MPKPHDFHTAFERALFEVSPRAVTLDGTDSTMDDARALARDGAPHLAVVVADFQSAGRGRIGRTWVSPPGLGLHATWIVRPDLPVERWTTVPLLAGVAAAEALRARAQVDATLKWPNDLLVGARKIGGILVEAEPPAFLLVGLGINVSHREFPDELASIATSVALEGGRRLDRADLLAATLKNFDAALDEPDGALRRYRELCGTLGERVRVERVNADPIEGVARDIDERGALLVDDGTPGGTLVASGDVHHLRAS